MAQPNPVEQPPKVLWPDRQELGMRLRLARRALGLNQAEVAERLGVFREPRSATWSAASAR